MMQQKVKHNLFISFVAGLMSIFFRKPKPSSADIQKLDFKTSTQKMGIRFSEKIRNAFRLRWIKKSDMR